MRARVEVAGVQQAQQQLRGLGTQINTVGQQSGQASQQVDRAGQQIGRAGQQAGTAGQRFTGLRQGISQLAPAALGAAGAVVGVGVAVKSAVDSSIEWESSLAGVAKTMDDTGLSAAGFDQAVADIGTEIRNMAMEIPIAATELAGVAEAAGQLGVARGDVVEFTETMALLGVATDLTAEQSATAIARISNITGLATEEVDNFGSALVDLGNNSAATESEILNMATRIAAAGEMAGLTEGEILGLAASLTSVGVRAEAGGTAVVQVMNEITTSVATADDRLSVFAELAGQSAEAFAASWRANPNEALVDFIEGLNRVTASGGDTVLVLDELGLDGIRVSQALNSAAGAGDLLRDSMDRGNTAFAENNALLQEAERRFETTASQIQIARNRINEAAITIGDAFTPALADALVGLADFTNAVVDAFSQDDFTNVVTQWETDLEDLGTAASTFPDPPEEQGDKWMTFASEMSGIDWQDVWEGFFPDEDRFAEFEDVPLPEVSDEHIARLEEIISLYENTPSRVRTVTESEYEHAQAMMEVIERHREFAALSQEERDALDGLLESFQAITSAAFDSGDATEETAERTRMYEENVTSLNRELEDGMAINEEWHTTNENVVDVMVELAEASRTATAEGHRHNQMIADTGGTLADIVNQYDEATVAAGTYERALSNVGAVTDAWRGVVDDSKSSMQLWEGDIRENEEALESLDEALANGVITQEEHREATESLEWWNRRLQSGVEDMTAEWALNRAAAADVTMEMEELQRQFEAGEINAAEYEAASAGLRAEWERQNDPISALISKIDELISRLFDLDNTEAEPEVDVSTIEGHRAMDAVHVDLDALDGRTATANVDADTASAHAAVAALMAAIRAGAILPVSIVPSVAGGGVGGGGPFQHGTGPGGVSRDMLALVGEAGPELAFLPQGTHILPNDETERFLALFGGGGIPGFQDGTGNRVGGAAGTGIDRSSFVDVGTMIGEAISVGVNLSLIESGQPTGTEFAQAIIDGAVTTIETEGADGVIESWVVAHDRIPALAASIGGDTVTALLEEYAALQGELQLAMLSGAETGEIQAQLDAIFALFATWSGNAVEEVEAIWDAITDEAKAAEAEALWADILGSIQMPSAPISFALEDLISGEAQQQLREDFMELWDLQRVFQEAGMQDQASAIGQQMRALGLQEAFIQSLLGTDFAQGLADEFASLDTAAAQQELWGQIFDVPIEELASGGFVESTQAALDELLADLQIAEALGLNADDLLAQITEQEALLAAAGEAMATPVVEEFAAGLNEVLEISDATLADLTTIFAEYSDIAEDMIDDVVQAVQDGRLPFEDAMSLLAQVPRRDLIPALEELEDQLTVNLAGALLEFGEDSPEVQAILTSLGLIESAANSVNDALGMPNLNQKTGEVAQLSGGGGGGTRVGGGGGLGGGDLGGSLGALPAFGTSFSPTAQGEFARLRATPEVIAKIAGAVGAMRGLIHTGDVDVDASSQAEWLFSADSERGLIGLQSFMGRLRGSPGPMASMYVGADGIREVQSGFSLQGSPFQVTPFDRGGMPSTSGMGFLEPHDVVLTPTAPALQPLAEAIVQELRGSPQPIIHNHFYVNGREIAQESLTYLSSGAPAGWSVGE